MAPIRQWCASVEYPDIVETQKTALENIFSGGILAIDPPGKSNKQFVKNGLEKISIGLSADFLLDFVNAPRGPTNHWRVYIAEIPFVGWYLPVRVLIPFAQN